MDLCEFEDSLVCIAGSCLKTHGLDALKWHQSIGKQRSSEIVLMYDPLFLTAL